MGGSPQTVRLAPDGDAGTGAAGRDVRLPVRSASSKRMQRFVGLLRSTALATPLLLTACGGAGSKPPAVAARPADDPASCPDVAARLLRSLQTPVRITAYVTHGAPRLDAFDTALVALLEGYRRSAPDRIDLTVVDVVTEAQRAAAKAAGLHEVAFGEKDPTAGATVRRGFMGLAMSYRGEKETLPIFSPGVPKGLGYWIVSRLRELRDRAEGRKLRIGVVGGKGEIKLTEATLLAAAPGEKRPTLQGILADAVPFYAIEPLDLRGGDAEIDPALAGLVLTQPSADYTERELRRVDEFLVRGGRSVAVIAGAVNVKADDPTMTVTLDTRGLPRLLDGYGVELRSAEVFDWGRPATLDVPGHDNPRKFSHPALVKVEDDPHLAVDTPPLDTTFPAFFRMEEVVFPFASALVAHPERQPDATLRIVARSSPRSTLSMATGADARLASALHPEGPYASHPLAIAVEGLVHSAFDGGRAPAPSRLLVIASSQFFTNPFARSAGSDEELRGLSRLYAQRYLTGTILAFKNVLDWMSNDRELNACSALAPVAPVAPVAPAAPVASAPR